MLDKLPTDSLDRHIPCLLLSFIFDGAGEDLPEEGRLGAGDR